MFYVYIIQSQSDGTFYIGHTRDIQERLLRHNQGRSRYTKPKRPWILRYTEEFHDRSSAMRREAALKSLHRRDLLWQLINSSV